MTGSELIAHLKEYEELQRNRPRYNVWQDRLEFKLDPSLNGHDEEFAKIEQRDILILDKGRTVGERSAIWIQYGELRGTGFYELNHQINNIHILESLITPMTNDKYVLQIIGTYLKRKKGFKIIDLKEEL